MPDWKIEYAQKKVTHSEAVSHIQSHQRIVMGHCAGEPVLLIDELMRQKDRLTAVEIVHMVPLGAAPYCQPEMASHFRHNSIFAGGATRSAVQSQRADYTPVFFSEVPRLFRENYLPVDVALITLSPPDENGYMSFGVSVDYTSAAAAAAKLVIAEVNSQMPRTFGTQMHVSEIDFAVETDRPLPILGAPKISEIEEQIGAHVAALISDGDTLQLGIGAIPDATLHFLTHKKDLGIHTEMFSDGVVHLYELGVITNARKSLHPGKFIATFLMGTSKLYSFVHNNPLVEMHPVDYTNNILVAGQIDNLISINSALQVDLYGQVCADSIGPKQFSGIGGQVDFVRAASLSRGGKSIIAMPSTAKNGTVSRIAVLLDPGACVSTSRNDVHYIVTEYGIAELRSKTLRQRAAALINIAHPDFREALKTDANALFNYQLQEDFL